MGIFFLTIIFNNLLVKFFFLSSSNFAFFSLRGFSYSVSKCVFHSARCIWLLKWGVAYTFESTWAWCLRNKKTRRECYCLLTIPPSVQVPYSAQWSRNMGLEFVNINDKEWKRSSYDPSNLPAFKPKYSPFLLQWSYRYFATVGLRDCFHLVWTCVLPVQVEK